MLSFFPHSDEQGVRKKGQSLTETAIASNFLSLYSWHLFFEILVLKMLTYFNAKSSANECGMFPSWNLLFSPLPVILTRNRCRNSTVLILALRLLYSPGFLKCLFHSVRECRKVVKKQKTRYLKNLVLNGQRRMLNSPSEIPTGTRPDGVCI